MMPDRSPRPRAPFQKPQLAESMAIDSIRLLTDSAAQLYRRLSAVHPIGVDERPFDEWFGVAGQQLDQAEEQALRRDYRRLVTMIDELETLVRSRLRALDLVREAAFSSETLS
jgi:hypothetical protein